MKCNPVPLFFIFLICIFSVNAQTGKKTAKRSPVQKSDTAVIQTEQTQRMTFDFQDTDIKEIVRGISIAYGLNIIIDKDITASVTIHLTDVPVIEGLKTVLAAHGLALAKEGDIYRIIKAEKKGKSAIAVAQRDTLNIDIDNVDIKEFIRDISSKAGVNIIAEKGVEGKISGTLRNINISEGIRALFEANGFQVRYRGDIMLISSPPAASSPQSNYNSRYSGGMMGGSGPMVTEISVRNGKIWMNLSKADIGESLRLIADQSRLNFITYGDVRGEVTAKLENVPLEKAISLLISGTNYAFSIRDSILLVGDRNSATPSGQALSTSELVHLKHVKADNFMTFLPRSIPSANILLVKEQNAILVTGTRDLIDQVRDFVLQVDIPTPQIMIEVIVVEFVKNEGQDWGIEAGEGKINDTAGVSYIPGLSLPYNGKWLKNHRPKEIAGIRFNTLGFLPDNFLLKLHALESEKKAKIMAQPRIATLNGNKASINVGNTSYFRLQGGTIENPLVRFQTIQSGIKLDLTPWISQSGQVTVEISPEISNSTGNPNAEGFPDISTRSVNTTICLNDGETIIIGGLIRAEENKTISKVPLLGSIPILGKLFQSEVRSKGQSELVIYVTPHILRDSDTVNLPEDLDQFKMRMKSNKEIWDAQKKETIKKNNSAESN